MLQTIADWTFLDYPRMKDIFFGHKTLDDTLTNSIYLWEFSYQIKNTKREIYLFIPCESNRPVWENLQTSVGRRRYDQLFFKIITDKLSKDIMWGYFCPSIRKIPITFVAFKSSTLAV